MLLLMNSVYGIIV